MRSAFADQVAELVKTLPDTAMPSGARHPNRVAISEVYEAYRKASGSTPTRIRYAARRVRSTRLRLDCAGEK